MQMMRKLAKVIVASSFSIRYDVSLPSNLILSRTTRCHMKHCWRLCSHHQYHHQHHHRQENDQEANQRRLHSNPHHNHRQDDHHKSPENFDRETQDMPPAYTGSAKLVKGTEVSEEIKERLRGEIAQLSVTPKLAIVQVGGREDSNVYIRAKVKFAEDVGVKAEVFKLPRTTTETELINQIDELNHNPNVHGIIVQLPFDCENHISQDKITNLVSPNKDVDGLSDLNAGKLFHGQVQPDGGCFLPCTPYGCMELIRKAGATVPGSSCVVIGRSKIVGSPMAQLLLWNNATVTVCHSKTKNTAELTKQADIVVVAAGCPELVKGSWIKPGAVVIDCGITAVDDPTKKSGKRLVGDVDFHEVKNVASAITPVPGGVGPMTVAMLISNTVQAARRATSKKISN